MQGRIAADGELSGKLSGGDQLNGALSSAGELTCVLSIESGLSGGLSTDGTLSGGLSFSTGKTPSYLGPYEFTPTDEAQIVQVGGLQMKQDLVIDPIPSNYGLITWNGSTLTVS